MISRIVRFSPQIQTPIRRSFATASPSNLPPPPSVTKAAASPVGGGAKAAKGTGPSTHPSPSEPKIKADPNPLWTFYQEHKHQRAAIAFLIVCGVSADACFTYFTFFRGRKEEEVIRTDTVGPHVISEEGTSPMEK
ncbi:hypothetical protein BGX26_002624 [Mortierella sp. AD094]|nr:hypothetical protein BGX26_002624 [Mortierella sp. AD094]